MKGNIIVLLKLHEKKKKVYYLIETGYQKKKNSQIVQKNILRDQLFEKRATLQFHEGSLKKDCIVYLKKFQKVWKSLIVRS